MKTAPLFPPRYHPHSRRVQWSILSMTCITILMLTGCDQNRYELGKDASGNTIRLDRRSGEVAIIKGDQIRTLKDAAQADAERKARLAELEKFKSWKDLDTTNLGARFTLSTSWRSGKMYYKFDVYSLRIAKEFQKWIDASQEKNLPLPKIDAKQRSSELLKVMSHRPFTVELNDGNGFRLAAIEILNPIRIVDDDGLAISFEDKGNIALSEDEYQRIAGWELRWRR